MEQINLSNDKLQQKVVGWADGKNLLHIGNILKQYAKTVSELGELGDALIKNEREETIDAIGDVQVCLIVLTKQLGLDYNSCLETAYNVITNRTGKTVNGTFIKDKKW